MIKTSRMAEVPRHISAAEQFQKWSRSSLIKTSGMVEVSRHVSTLKSGSYSNRTAMIKPSGMAEISRQISAWVLLVIYNDQRQRHVTGQTPPYQASGLR